MAFFILGPLVDTVSIIEAVAYICRDRDTALMTTKRQLAAIMFTDITGYSAMMQADEEYARRIRHRHRSVFREAHSRHGGTILQYYGDGTLSIFDSAAAAVECAVEMQIEYRKEPEVPLRIGIHTGDISYDDDGAYGDGLNIASRVEKLAIPGSVYITAKVFDDIKNHKWLTALSLGRFRLRNINRPLEIYAITCKGVDYPTMDELLEYPELLENAEYQEQRKAKLQQPQGMRKKGRATVLAFFLGWSGVHRLYLGRRTSGLIWLIASMLALMITVNVDPDFPPIMIFWIIGFIDFVLLAAMSRVEFDFKYNEISRDEKPTTTARSHKARRREYRSKSAERWAANSSPAPVRRRSSAPSRPSYKVRNPALALGLKLYKQGEYEDAVEAFDEALELDETATAAYFNLACCHSILRNAEEAYASLEGAVANGFQDFNKIKTHQALAFLRSRSDYDAFVANNYRVVSQLPEPKENLIEEIQKFDPLVLDKLEDLGNMLESGELTREQFDEQKRKILGHE